MILLQLAMAGVLAAVAAVLLWREFTGPDE